MGAWSVVREGSFGEANAMYFHLGILAYDLIKLMQLLTGQVLVLSSQWKTRTIRSVRTGLFRMVAKVTTGGHSIWLQVNKTAREICYLLEVREKIYLLSVS